MSVNPDFPIYIVSKGRAESRMTSRTLEAMGVPYRIVVEEQERDQYAAVIDPGKILVLDPAYQRDFDTFDDLGDTKGKGPGPARNFVWDHSISEGAARHWVMDDNISWFAWFHKNLKCPVGDGTILKAMEDFVARYTNIAMAGPQYEMFITRKDRWPALTLNTRVYSCNLIRNDIPFRWRGRYNEDTDLSLRILKAGWCTLLFGSLLQKKINTQKMTGGNTAEFYAKDGTLPKSAMLVKMHPDVTRLVRRYGRWHHHVDYRSFKRNKLRRRADIDIPPGIDNYGMVLKFLDGSEAA